MAKYDFVVSNIASIALFKNITDKNSPLQNKYSISFEDGEEKPQLL